MLSMLLSSQCRQRLGYHRVKAELNPLEKKFWGPTLNLQNFTYRNGLTASRQILRPELGQVGPAR
jgi:hypothetical protein